MFSKALFGFLLAVALLQCRPTTKKEKEIFPTADSINVLVPDTSQQLNNGIAPAADSFELNFAPEQLDPQKVTLPVSGETFNLQLPKGFRITAAAQVQRRLRFMAKSTDGRLFATDMYDLTDNKKGRVLIFDKWNADRKQFDTVYTYLNNLHNPNQIAFYNGYLYVAETGRLARYAYEVGSNIAKDTGQTIARFPDYGLSYKYGGWHLTRSVAFYNDKLYVSIGSSCNACVETETNRAVILEMNPDGSNSQIYARGLRNAVGLRFINGRLWVTGMGRDLMGPDKPEDLFQEVTKDGYFGWPYYFQYRQRIYEDENFKDSSRAAYVQAPPKAMVGFKAHSAPLGFDFFKAFDHPALNSAVLVCLHGSTSVWRQRGYEVVRLEKGDTYTPFITGFLTGKNTTDRNGRPCDVLQNDGQSFFVTDDLKGVLYYVWRE
jgi:glucose/arabinose dehydrogenase